MKECPFCKAEIEENARFCLYCMNILCQKQNITPQKRRSCKRLTFTIGILLLCAVIIFLSLRNTPPETPIDSTPLLSTYPSVDEPGTESYRTRRADSADATFFPAGSDVCWYRLCTSDDYPGINLSEGYMAELPEGQVACGIYSIRDSLQGIKVVAIDSGALPDDVVMLTVSQNVEYIAPYALSRCVELKYLCLKGEKIRFDESIFPDIEDRWYQIIIRCSSTCQNDQGEYIKDIAGRYGAVWEEWSG